ncbi:MAG: hypothetical protein J6J15_06660 [Oscillospiraceae bacterium]|nr:hypothetical protein [Oscillospiraceae bacterium]
MKKIIILFFVFILVIISSSCAKENETETEENKTDYTNIEENIQVEENIETEKNIEEPKPIGISYYEAQEQGGFFILKSDGSFVSLCEEIISQKYTQPENLFKTDGKNEEMVYLCENEKLVLFSNKSIMDEYYFLPVLEEGYTVPFDFYESNDGIYFLNMDFRDSDGKLIMNYDDYQIVDVLSHFGKWKGEELRVCFNNANGVDAKTFYDNETIDLEDYCTDSGSGCFSDIIFFTKNFNEKVTVDFYSGTQYFEETFYADIKCYIIDGCAKKDFSQSVTGKTYYSGTAITPEFTKEGYVILDTSSLENGKYVIANVGKSIFENYNTRELFEISR